MKSYSLTRRLITMVLLVELASALMVSGVALVYERHMHFRSFDILLRGRADSLLGSVQDAEDAEDNVMLDGSEVSLPAEDIYEVTDATGRVVGSSKNWPGEENLRTRGESSRETHRTDAGTLEEQRFFRTAVGRESYRVIEIKGLRVVDSGDKDGGVRRYVTVYYGAPVDRLWRDIERTVGFYAGSSLFVLAITGLLMSWLLNRGLAPLRELASTAASVSVASWSFNPPESARATRELQPLIAALESVLRGLEQSFEKQKRFVGDAAHELKTGVAVVKSSIQLLNMKPRKQADYQAGLERCLEDCVRMEEMVAQMLTLARVEEELSTPPELTQTDAHYAIRELMSQLQPMADNKRISITVGDPDHLVWSEPVIVQIEPSQFKLLMSNLLVNALQHSPLDSIVRVGIKVEESLAEIDLYDSGEGIEASTLPTIFDRFSRGDPSRSRHTGGTGLGLAICKAIVDRFKGSIEILSEPGVGTQVKVLLPLAKGSFHGLQPYS